jgi:hypothetical protein
MTNERNSIPRPLSNEDRRLLHGRFVAGYDPNHKRPPDHGLAGVFAVLCLAGWLPML